MKKTYLLVVIIALIINITGCTSSVIQGTSETISVNPVPASSELDPIPDFYESPPKPILFENEERFIKAVKADDGNGEWDLKSIIYYYRPKNLPDGAILQEIRVFDSHVGFEYTLDTDKNSTDATKMVSYSWYRGFNGGAPAFIKDVTSRFGCVIVNLESQTEGTTYMAEKSFSQAKASKDVSGYPSWNLLWVQDCECFDGSIPWNIPESDIVKYLEMEKVIVE